MGLTGKKTAITVTLVRVVPMHKAGYHKWSPSRRARLHPFTYRQLPNSWIVPVREINTKKGIGVFVCDLVGEGVYQLRGYSKAKTRTHVKPVTLADVKIVEGRDGSDVVSYVKPRRVKRYWFWKDH